MLQGSAYIHIEEDVSMEDFQFSSPQKLYKKGARCAAVCSRMRSRHNTI